jgi:hypothetical protein
VQQTKNLQICVSLRLSYRSSNPKHRLQGAGKTSGLPRETAMGGAMVNQKSCGRKQQLFAFDQ